MKCPKCDKDVPEGFLFCPHCLAEIPWVKEYDTVETRLEKKRLEEKDTVPEETRTVLPERPEPKERHRQSFLKWMFTGTRLIALWILAAAAVYLLIYGRTHTYEAYYQRAVSAMDNGDYAQALEYIELAIEKAPDSLEANRRLAQILELDGRPDEAILVLTPLIALYPDNEEIYLEMCRLLALQERYDEIRTLLDECDRENVLEACSDYICEEPVSSLEEGIYAGWESVELKSSEGKIYYTLNGEEPTSASIPYESPIILKEGTTVLKALCVNGMNVPSDVVTWNYVVTADVPSPPEISPESGIFHEKTRIEILVPDGCKACYAFDEMPTENSTEYTAPILMPTGAHVFYAVLISANGNVSDYSFRDYYLEY